MVRVRPESGEAISVPSLRVMAKVNGLIGLDDTINH